MRAPSKSTIIAAIALSACGSTAPASPSRGVEAPAASTPAVVVVLADPAPVPPREVVSAVVAPPPRAKPADVVPAPWDRDTSRGPGHERLLRLMRGSALSLSGVADCGRLHDGAGATLGEAARAMAVAAERQGSRCREVPDGWACETGFMSGEVSPAYAGFEYTVSHRRRIVPQTLRCVVSE